MNRIVRVILLLSTIISLSGCEQIAVGVTPAKKADPQTTPLSIKAERAFWNAIHGGRYDDIPNLDYLLTAAYLENPNNPKLAAHLGFIHIWKIAERERLSKNSPLITEEIILAKKYFNDAHHLSPNNPIYHGFLGDALLIEGQIYQDKREEVRGYFELKAAIKEWPEFNYFTAGYPMSKLDASSAHFKEAVEWQWKTLDRCANTRVNRQNPDFSPYLKLETQYGRQRACWNSWAAPHNFEGFFMNMGDMLVKSGDWQTAIILYRNAKLAKNYQEWPYKGQLEARIREAKANVNYFQEPSKYPTKNMMFGSRYACMACHQR